MMAVLDNADQEVLVDERNRFRALIMRGTLHRAERTSALYEFWQNLDEMHDLLGQTARSRRFRDLALDFITALAQSDELEIYMGSSTTDGYGIVTDADVGREGVRFGLKWHRDMPLRRIFIEISLAEAVGIGIAVDRHRARKGSLEASALETVLPPRVWNRVLDEVVEAATSRQDHDELLETLARAMDAQSILRVAILAESFPSLASEES